MEESIKTLFCFVLLGMYSLPTSLVVDISQSILPKWLESGHYKARAQLSDHNSNQVLCIDLSLTVATKDNSIKPNDNYI